MNQPKLNAHDDRKSKIAIRKFLGSRRHVLRFLTSLLDSADHVERLFRHVVALSFENLAETLDGIGDLDVLALETRELLSDRERL